MRLRYPSRCLGFEWEKSRLDKMNGSNLRAEDAEDAENREWESSIGPE
jgi:hypothetical protein